MQVPATGAVCASIAQARRIHVGDVLALRHSLLAAGRASRQEAESLFALAGENLPACAQWREFFIEAIADCISGGRMRDAHLSEADAQWLIAMIERAPLDDGLEFALACEVMGRTQCCPSILMRFVLGRLNDLSEPQTRAKGRNPPSRPPASPCRPPGSPAGFTCAGRLPTIPSPPPPRDRARPRARPLAYGRA